MSRLKAEWTCVEIQALMTVVYNLHQVMLSHSYFHL